MDFSTCVADQLSEAQMVLDCLGGNNSLIKSDRLAWLDGQLRHVTAELLALQTDIESGWSFSAMDGSFSVNDFEELMDVYRATISNLKSMMEIAKMLDR